MIRIVVVEDNATTLRYLEMLLSGTEGIEVVGAYGSGNEALLHVPERTPDVLIADLNLPDISGIEVIKTLHAQLPSVEILVLTMHEDRERLFSAIKAGATGYLLKGAGAVEIVNAVSELVKGGAPMSPRIARYVLEEFKENQDQKTEALLTPREREVLDGVARGLSERKLADTLSLSVHTVHTHIKKIYRKLHAGTKTEAIMKAKSKGII